MKIGEWIHCTKLVIQYNAFYIAITHMVVMNLEVENYI